MSFFILPDGCLQNVTKMEDINTDSLVVFRVRGNEKEIGVVCGMNYDQKTFSVLYEEGRIEISVSESENYGVQRVALNTRFAREFVRDYFMSLSHMHRIRKDLLEAIRFEAHV